jgi:hypothetical protein
MAAKAHALKLGACAKCEEYDSFEELGTIEGKGFCGATGSLKSK